MIREEDVPELRKAMAFLRSACMHVRKNGDPQTLPSIAEITGARYTVQKKLKVPVPEALMRATDGLEHHSNGTVGYAVRNGRYVQPCNFDTSAKGIFEIRLYLVECRRHLLDRHGLDKVTTKTTYAPSKPKPVL